MRTSADYLDPVLGFETTRQYRAFGSTDGIRLQGSTLFEKFPF